ncbi:hypothetical protein [Aliigemmobacter aestuarii]|nr:hypothetical protein [Gemmobacter aestuarii]
MIVSMIAVAEDYEASEELLAGKVDPRHGRAANLLGLLAFEIRLKCAVLVDTGQRPVSHSYDKLLYLLSESARLRIVELATDRSAGHVDFSRFEEILRRLSRAFTLGRYDYELNDQRQPHEAREAGSVWIANGGDPFEADVAFFPMEREALNFGLATWLQENTDTLLA